MNRLGLDQLRKHVPETNSVLGFIGLILPALLLSASASILINSHSIPWPSWSLDGSLIFFALGFTLLFFHFRLRDELVDRFDTRAFSLAFRWLGFPGVTTVFVVVAHIGSMQGPELPQKGISAILGWLLVIEGFGLFLRTLQTFGLDYLVTLYMYFPEESRLVSRQIYSVLGGGCRCTDLRAGHVRHGCPG